MRRIAISKAVQQGAGLATVGTLTEYAELMVEQIATAEEEKANND